MFSIPLKQITVATIAFIGIISIFYFVIEKRGNHADSDSAGRKTLLQVSRYKMGILRTNGRRKVKKLKMKGSFDPSLPTLSPEAINGVKTFAFFIGYPRSGHSIVGSILDAHPHIVMSHEFMFLQQWSRFHGSGLSPSQCKANLLNMIYQKSYLDTQPGGDRYWSRKGYTLAIPSLWQGKFDRHVDVIGDKSGGSISLQYINDEAAVKARLKMLASDLSVPIKVIHVIRNPYDTIATRLLYTIGKKSSMNTANFVVKIKTQGTSPSVDMLDMYMNNSARFRQRMKGKIESFFGMAKAIEELSEFMDQKNVLNVHHKDLVHHPEQTIEAITTFLGVNSDQKYLKACADKIFKTISKSRYLVTWPEGYKAMVQSRIQEFSMLKEYSFTSD